MKTVYTCFSTGVIHEGHLNIIREARKYGSVIVGALTDRAMVSFNRFPTLTIEERISLYEGIEGVDRVVVQDDMYYDEVIEELHPDYVIHGDNWCSGPEMIIRQNVISLLESYGGKLIELSYTRNESVIKTDRKLIEKLSMPEYRRKRLKQALNIRPIVKVIEAHSGLTGLIAEKTVVENKGVIDQFDGMWVSSLCDSTDRGKPDIELVDMTSRLRTIEDIMDVTTKPIILDGDTGGLTEHFVYNVRTLERKGVSAVIIEDKTGLKKNSLFGTEVEQTQDTIENFCEKIAAGKRAQLTDDFMIIARIESLILEKGMDDALKRAFAFRDAGADGIMIHSRKKVPDEIFDFCDRFRKEDKDTPLVVVPTSFNSVTEDELAAHGINIVIYANQLMRAAFPAMQRVAEEILKNHRALEVDDLLMPFKEIIRLIDEM
ncbi:MAG: phosphoenolpyruvate mutase [Lachnospiraceae bacterium]|nr:phosphoenolpyruvate mutase [Lachnospiraceae bacterium]